MWHFITHLLFNISNFDLSRNDYISQSLVYFSQLPCIRTVTLYLVVLSHNSEFVSGNCDFLCHNWFYISKFEYWLYLSVTSLFLTIAIPQNCNFIGCNVVLYLTTLSLFLITVTFYCTIWHHKHNLTSHNDFISQSLVYSSQLQCFKTVTYNVALCFTFSPPHDYDFLIVVVLWQKVTFSPQDIAKKFISDPFCSVFISLCCKYVPMSHVWMTCSVP